MQNPGDKDSKHLDEEPDEAESPDGSYYYDDATGYEPYEEVDKEDDDE